MVSCDEQPVSRPAHIPWHPFGSLCYRLRRWPTSAAELPNQPHQSAGSNFQMLPRHSRVLSLFPCRRMPAAQKGAGRTKGRQLPGREATGQSPSAFLLLVCCSCRRWSRGQCLSTCTGSHSAGLVTVSCCTCRRWPRGLQLRRGPLVPICLSNLFCAALQEIPIG